MSWAHRSLMDIQKGKVRIYCGCSFKTQRHTSVEDAKSEFDQHVFDAGIRELKRKTDARR